MGCQGVFCVPLELLVDREGTESVLGATPVPLRIPSFIDDIVSSMKQMGRSTYPIKASANRSFGSSDMSVEGIFRKNGNIRRMNQVIEMLDKDTGSVDLSTDNPVQLAALLKRFLRDLPDPLLTYKLHKLWIGTQSWFPIVSLVLSSLHVYSPSCSRWARTAPTYAPRVLAPS